MTIPRWYKILCLIWLFTGLPLQWFFTAFNGLSFFSLPDAPGPNGSPFGVWILGMLFIYHPIILAPIALWQSWTRRVKVDQ